MKTYVFTASDNGTDYDDKQRWRDYLRYGDVMYFTFSRKSKGEYVLFFAPTPVNKFLKKILRK